MINKIYLAGGMQNLSPKEQGQWRAEIIDNFKNYDLEFFNPANYNFDSRCEIKRFFIQELKTSDLIIVNFNDPKSIGAAQELQCAFDFDIPVVGMWEDEENKQRKLLGKAPKKLHPWLIESCNKIFDNAEDLCNYIKDFYLERGR